MQRSESWSQTPAIVSRLTSWKGAGQDYSAMQVVPTGKRPLGSDMPQNYETCLTLRVGLSQSMQLSLHQGLSAASRGRARPEGRLPELLLILGPVAPK